MRIALGLGVYVFTVVGIAFGTVSAVTWISSLKPAEAMDRPRVIPQKIAESIERKRAAVVREERPDTPQPEMKAAHVSLNNPVVVPRQMIRELPYQPSNSRRPKAAPRLAKSKAVAVAVAPDRPVAAAQGRSDFPY